MEFKRLGNTNEKIPEIGIGTWKMGIHPDNERNVLRIAMECGIKFIDTAEMYGTEWIVSRAIRGVDDVFIATKVSPNHFSYKDVISSCNQSLKNLGVKTIDLYQLHWPNHHVPISETMRAMEDLVDAGKIRHIGVSNFTVKEFVEAQNSMKRHDIVSNQVEYSIFVRDPEPLLLDFCNKNKITLIAYSPFARGALFQPKHASAFAKLEAIGKAHGKTASQVALNWLISKKGVVAIPKAASREHVFENAGASGWGLSKKEEKEIDSITERNQSLTGVLHPVLKTSGIWARAAHSFYIKKPKAQKKRKTTRSSKK